MGWAGTHIEFFGELGGEILLLRRVALRDLRVTPGGGAAHRREREQCESK